MKVLYWQFLLFVGFLLPAFGLSGQSGQEPVYEEPVWLNEAPRDTSFIDSLMKEGFRIQNLLPGKSLTFMNMARDLAVGLKNKKREASALRGIGMSYSNLGMISRSIEIYGEEMKLRMESGNSRQLGWLYNNLGNNYITIQAEEKAYEYFEKSRQAFIEVGDSIRATYPLVNLAAHYRDQGRYQESLDMYNDILMVNDGGDKVFQRDRVVYNNIGFSHESMGDFVKAKEFYLKALKLKYEEEDFYSAVNTLDNLTSVSTKLGDFKAARMYLDSTRSMIQRHNAQEYLAPSMRTASFLFHETGDDKAAFLELKAHLELNDSLNTMEQAAKVNNIMMVMNEAEQDAQIQLLQKDNELMNSSTQQKNMVILALVIGLLLLTGLIIARWRFTRQLRQANETLKLNGAKISAQNEEIAKQKNNLEAQNEALELAIQEKDGLIGFVAHDLKAPVNKTIGLLNMLENSEHEGAQSKQVVGLLNKVNRNALELINDLLLISEVEMGKGPENLEAIDMQTLLSNTAGEFSTMASKKNIQIILKTEEEVQLRAHAKSVQRILDNFVSNAIKYSPSGSEVCIGFEKTGHGLQVFVRDEGPGISEADQAKMFRKFQKLTARPTGGESSHGLGLAIAKSLADRLGARIHCESVPGKGSTFFLTFNAA